MAAPKKTIIAVRGRAPRTHPVRRCIFCPGKPDTREHAWSEWAMKRFADAGNRLAWRGDVRTWHADPYQKSIKVRCVCEQCNGGWMHDLEEAVIPTAGAMMADVPTALNVPQQWALTLWIIKTAMVFEFSNRNRNSIFYEDADRFSLRESSTVPPFTAVWLARYSGDSSFFSSVIDWNGTSPHHGNARALMVTLGFARMIVKVVTIRPDQKHTTITVPEPMEWPDAMVRVFPHVDSAHWPPPRTISHDDSHAFNEFFPLQDAKFSTVKG